MKTVLADIFTRLLAEIGQGESACLRVPNTNAVEGNQTIKTAIGTALIHGVEGGKAQSLAAQGRDLADVKDFKFSRVPALSSKDFLKRFHPD